MGALSRKAVPGSNCIDLADNQTVEYIVCDGYEFEGDCSDILPRALQFE